MFKQELAEGFLEFGDGVFRDLTGKVLAAYEGEVKAERNFFHFLTNKNGVKTSNDAIEVNILCKLGEPLTIVARRLQLDIYQEIKNLTGIELHEININIVGILY